MNDCSECNKVTIVQLGLRALINEARRVLGPDHESITYLKAAWSDMQWFKEDHTHSPNDTHQYDNTPHWEGDSK
jgi:hypothetical protein